jgi:hypothetical protein
MMQIEQSALGTWNVALCHWRSGSWARESDSVRIAVIFMRLLWRDIDSMFLFKLLSGLY